MRARRRGGTQISSATYEKAIEKLELIGKKELLEALARLQDKRRDDPRRALEAWERLFALDETDHGVRSTRWTVLATLVLSSIGRRSSSRKLREARRADLGRRVRSAPYLAPHR